MAEESEDIAGAKASKSDSSGELPATDSPPLSPASETAAAPEPALDPTDIVVFSPAAAAPLRARFRFRPRHKRHALLAASVAFAAALGVVVGMAAGGGFDSFGKSKPQAGAGLAERHAMQRSIGKLGKEIAALKSSLAAAEKSARSDIAKTAARVPETTGSIAAPPSAIPTPQPRPATTSAALRPPLVRDWAIRFVRDGYVYVGQEHGDVYQVQLGAPLPGLGPVEAVRHQDGRWLVVTPKGLIVAERDRRFFAPF